MLTVPPVPDKTPLSVIRSVLGLLGERLKVRLPPLTARLGAAMLVTVARPSWEKSIAPPEPTVIGPPMTSVVMPSPEPVSVPPDAMPTAPLPNEPVRFKTPWPIVVGPV